MGKDEEHQKTPEQMADKEVNKILAKGIAERKIKIKQHQAEIKKLEKEIEKIKSGELVPADSSNTPTPQKYIQPSTGVISPYQPYRQTDPNKFYRWTTSNSTSTQPFK